MKCLLFAWQHAIIKHMPFVKNQECRRFIHHIIRQISRFLLQKRRFNIGCLQIIRLTDPAYTAELNNKAFVWATTINHSLLMMTCLWLAFFSHIYNSCAWQLDTFNFSFLAAWAFLSYVSAVAAARYPKCGRLIVQLPVVTSICEPKRPEIAKLIWVRVNGHVKLRNSIVLSCTAPYTVLDMPPNYIGWCLS